MHDRGPEKRWLKRQNTCFQAEGSWLGPWDYIKEKTCKFEIKSIFTFIFCDCQFKGPTKVGTSIQSFLSEGCRLGRKGLSFKSVLPLSKRRSGIFISHLLGIMPLLNINCSSTFHNMTLILVEVCFILTLVNEATTYHVATGQLSKYLLWLNVQITDFFCILLKFPLLFSFTIF